MRFLRFLLVLAIVLAIAVVALRLIYPLPDLPEEPASTARPISEETTLGAALLPATAAHQGKTGIWPLADGREAYAARILLARAAQDSIDLQYYIWQTDETGWMLLDEVRKAAERGVRVRLLLDDNGIPGLDAELAALNARPNIEVRIFNPFTLRSPKLLSYAFDFPRLNHRMHNKAMIVDGAATVLGGRNIGNIYFDYGQGVHYFDADVLAAGPVVADVSQNFDRYWASGSSYPAELILPDAPGGMESLLAHAEQARATALAAQYIDAIAETPLVQRIEAGTLTMEWGDVTFFSDDPAKGLGEAEEDELLISRIIEIAQPKKSFDLVSAYFIPGEGGTEILTGFAADGVRTRTLTNALASTDVVPVHGAYMKYRDDLVAEGVEVLELRPEANRVRERGLSSMIVGSASSLHAKTFTVDGEQIFVGSFNFDPRSARLNTEMGLLIPSPKMAQGLARVLDEKVQYYRVAETAEGRLIWIEAREDGSEVVRTKEPETTLMQRAFARLVSWLPVEWML
ncbi:phospholipase D family protein [Pseudooceanicola nanhaiensis]|uniref:phospholipase D family protein n=1 Tax=Pseudooceanicola nanhaiensis TaxID=375761 RepID=UPI001CD1D11D|nr:phospholipase D family protein [Pseudooceanicola nanhaiensis]MCA0922595.1 phospholipase D family protein [Pseudooceanicola nanhaiensis]